MTASPWRVPGALIAVMTVLVLAGCSPHIDASMIGTTPKPAAVASIPRPAPFTRPVAPATESWGGVGDQLSIIVRNTSSRTIVLARVRIEAMSASGAPIPITTVQPTSTCCTVLDVAPGGRFGVFANLGARVGDVRKVRVAYVGPVLTTSAPPSVHIVVRNTSLHLSRDDAVVSATVSVSGTVPAYMAGQAFLVNRQGRVVGVISGRFYCFGDGTTRRLRMQLLHPVPLGTRLAQVVLAPVPPAAVAPGSPRCAQPR